MTSRAKATTLGVLSGAVFFPVELATICNGECHTTVSTFWGLALPGAVATLAPFAVAMVVGVVSYRLLSRCHPRNLAGIRTRSVSSNGAVPRSRAERRIAL